MLGVSLKNCANGGRGSAGYGSARGIALTRGGSARLEAFEPLLTFG